MNEEQRALEYGVVYWRFHTRSQQHGFATFEEAKSWLVDGENTAYLASEAITRYGEVIRSTEKDGRSPEGWFEP